MSKNPFVVILLPSADVDIGRWLLQHWQIDYDEHPDAPIFHVLALKWYGSGNADAPLFICDDQKFPDVEAMVKRFDPLAALENRVLPDKTTEKALHDEVVKLQHDFRFGMGVGTVHWAYYQLFPHKNLTWASFTTGVPWFETLFLTFGYSLIKFLMYKGLSLSAEQAQKGLDNVKDGFDRCEQILSDGRRYLAADRLTLADLAFAAYGAPMVLADGYGGQLRTIDKVTPEMRSVVTEMRARPAGAYVKRLYDEHRLKALAWSGAVKTARSSTDAGPRKLSRFGLDRRQDMNAPGLSLRACSCLTSIDGSRQSPERRVDCSGSAPRNSPSPNETLIAMRSRQISRV